MPGSASSSIEPFAAAVVAEVAGVGSVGLALDRVRMVVDGSRASAFTFSYKGTAGSRSRPVVFCWNGGPGSSSSLLHLGGFAPWVLDLPTPSDPCAAPRLRRHADHLLDVADFVFVDPTESGFGRLDEPEGSSSYYGIRQDALATALIVEAWLRHHDRAESPVVFVGESYGALRAAHTALALHDRASGIGVSAIVMLAGAIDLQSMALGTPGNDSPSIAYLPSFAAISEYHRSAGVPGPERHARAVQAARRANRFAAGPYAASLNGASTTRRLAHVATTIAELTGLDAETILEHGLRPDLETFRAHVLPGRRVGLWDGRFDGPATGADDPSDAAVAAPFASAIAQLLADDWTIPTPDVEYVDWCAAQGAAWDWHTSDQWRMGYPHVAAALIPLAEVRPELTITSIAGMYDLAAPAAMIERALRVPGVPADRVRSITVPSGHMITTDDAARRVVLRETRLAITSARRAIERGERCR